MLQRCGWGCSRDHVHVLSVVIVCPGAAQVRLALHTLGTFDFNDVALLPFVRNVVLGYLSHEDALIRREAALTCSRCSGARAATFVGACHFVRSG
jgi:hypothetical protein